MLKSIEDILSIELLTLFDPIAASPDGTRLAVAVQSYSRKRVGTGIDDQYLPTGLVGVQEGQAKMGGSLWEFPERYIENSPIFFLDKVETPLLLVVGALDVLAVPQAGEMFSGLRRLGKTAVLARYEGEGHAQVSTWRYPNVFDYWQRVLAWFDEHFPEDDIS